MADAAARVGLWSSSVPEEFPALAVVHTSNVHPDAEIGGRDLEGGLNCFVGGSIPTSHFVLS